MTKAKKPETFASVSLDAHKEQLARLIRTHAYKNDLSYTQIMEIFGLSRAAVSRIMNGAEKFMTFETLYIAVVTSGVTVSLMMVVPE